MAHRNDDFFNAADRSAYIPANARTNVHTTPPINTNIATYGRTASPPNQLAGTAWSQPSGSPVSPSGAMAGLNLGPPFGAAPAGTLNPTALMPNVIGPATINRPPDHQQRLYARTALRERLNRNGNRLCAWCEPRRERREYSPRTAPDDMMNCGCSVKEALFEESLSRNGVGSMSTGPMRLDPSLRRALLEVLERVYNYEDGDLDFDRATLQWFSGAGDAEYWESRDRFPKGSPEE